MFASVFFSLFVRPLPHSASLPPSFCLSLCLSVLGFLFTSHPSFPMLPLLILLVPFLIMHHLLIHLFYFLPFPFLLFFSAYFLISLYHLATSLCTSFLFFLHISKCRPSSFLLFMFLAFLLPLVILTLPLLGNSNI